MGISGLAEVLSLLDTRSHVHRGMDLKNFPIFQVDRQHRDVQNDRHFFADGALLGLAVYLENASKRLPLPAR